MSSGPASPGASVVDALLWAAAGALAATVVVMSIVPQPPVPPDLSDKFVHGAGYAALTGSVLLAGVWRPGRGRGRWPGAGALVAVGAAALGAALEVVQGVAGTGRAGEIADAVANSVGAAAALGLWAAARSAVGRG